MDKTKLLATFFYSFAKKEKLYLFSAFVISFILCFILLLLILSKEIYTHYSNIESALLPDAIALIDTDLATLKNTLLLKNKEYLLHGELLNMKNASFAKSASGTPLIPKDYTLLAFDLDTTWPLTICCGTTNIQAKLQDLYMLKRGTWTLKSAPLSCHKKNITLITQKGELNLNKKYTTPHYTLLEYHSNELDDAVFYPYVIKTLQEKFLDYYPSSQHYLSRSNLTPDTQKHAKMIEALSSILFAGKQKRVIANTESFKYFKDYEKLSFYIYPENYLSNEKVMVVDELPFPVNENVDINSFLFLANLSSFSEIKFDKRFVFFTNIEEGKLLFPNATWVEKKELSTNTEQFITNINTAFFAIILLLLIFMIAFIHSFITRIYAAYDAFARILLLNGLNFKILSALLVIFFVFAIAFAHIAAFFMLENINYIFMNHYIDLIEYQIEVAYLYFAFILLLFIALFFESLSHKNNMKNYKG